MPSTFHFKCVYISLQMCIHSLQSNENIFHLKGVFIHCQVYFILKGCVIIAYLLVCQYTYIIVSNASWVKRNALTGFSCRGEVMCLYVGCILSTSQWYILSTLWLICQKHLTPHSKIMWHSILCQKTSIIDTIFPLYPKVLFCPIIKNYLYKCVTPIMFKEFKNYANNNNKMPKRITNLIHILRQRYIMQNCKLDCCFIPLA